jgi:hypothetical protein
MEKIRDKRSKFVELAEARVARALDTIRLIGNLSNKNNYDYTDSDCNKIIAALEAEIRNLRTKFKSEDGKSKAEFKL